MPDQDRGGDAAGRLGPLLAPRSVAVVGASAHTRSLGFQVVRNLDSIGFPGEVWPVHPGGEPVLGHATCRTAADLPKGIDLAIVALSSERVLASLSELADRGIVHSIVYAAGFAESGAPGEALQRDLDSLARERGLIVSGPNCSGYVAFHRHTNTKFGHLLEHGIPPAGTVALVTQSGGMGGTVFTLASAAGVGFSYIINSGNEAVVDLSDYVEFLVDVDDQTRTVCLYAETLRRGEKLLELAHRAQQRGKRILAVLGGRTEAGARAAFSHTGSLTTDRSVARALLTEAGVVLLRNQEEMAYALQLVGGSRPAPRSRRVVVITSSGANGVVTSDLLEEAGLEVGPLPSAMADELAELLPEYASGNNPIDMTGNVFGDDPDAVGRIIDVVDRHVDGATLLLTAAQHPVAYERTAAVVAPVLGETVNFPVATWLAPSPAIVESFRAAAVPFFPSPALLAGVLGRLLGAEPTSDGRARPGGDAVSHDNPSASGDRNVWTEDVVKALLREYGIRVPRGELAQSVEDAVAVAARVGFPVALKVCSAQMAHRMRHGLISLGVRDEGRLRAEWERLHRVLRTSHPGVEVRGILVEEMCDPGPELFVGINGRSSFGPVLAFGLGGAMAEVLGHVDVARLPLDGPGARRLVSGLRADRFLPSTSLVALQELLVSLSGFWEAHPQIVEMDCNPVICLPDGPLVADALAVAAPMPVHPATDKLEKGEVVDDATH